MCIYLYITGVPGPGHWGKLVPPKPGRPLAERPQNLAPLRHALLLPLDVPCGPLRVPGRFHGRQKGVKLASNGAPALPPGTLFGYGSYRSDRLWASSEGSCKRVRSWVSLWSVSREVLGGSLRGRGRRNGVPRAPTVIRREPEMYLKPSFWPRFGPT